MAEEITWDDACTSGGFIKLEEDKEKILTIVNWKFEKVEKFSEEQIEFQADVTEEDGQPVKETVFTTSSRRLKMKLRPIIEGKDPTAQIKLGILKVGDKFDTQLLYASS